MRAGGGSCRRRKAESADHFHCDPGHRPECRGGTLDCGFFDEAGAEIHGYEPTPADIRRASDADLILDNGLNLENWFAQFVEDVDAPHVTVSDGVDPIDITEDEDAGKPNPHAWMSPVEVEKYVDNMVTAFSELDPDHAEDFKQNGEQYKRSCKRSRTAWSLSWRTCLSSIAHW